MKFSLLIVTALILLACNSSDKKVANPEKADSTKNVIDSTSVTTIQWLDSTEQNLGKAKEGQVLEISWRFKNSGDKPLIFSDVHPGCGCTLADKPEQPVAPGEEGVIKAKFDTKGRLHSQFKQIFVKANNSNKNSPGEDILAFKVEVEAN